MTNEQTKLSRADVQFSITILQDNIEHLNTMLSVKNGRAERYGSKCELGADVAALMRSKRDSLSRTAEWLATKVSTNQAPGEQH